MYNSHDIEDYSTISRPCIYVNKITPAVASKHVNAQLSIFNKDYFPGMKTNIS